MINSKWYLLFAAILFMVVISFPVLNRNIVSFAKAENDNTSAATLTVSGILDTTINCSSLNLGTGFTPGTNNGTRSDTQQCKMTINSNTNTHTTIAVNSSSFANNTVVFGQQNVTYTNNSGTQGSCLTSFIANFMSGNCPASAANYTDWVNIGAPAGSNIDRNMYFNVTVPSTLPKGTYSGSIYIKFLDVG